MDYSIIINKGLENKIGLVSIINKECEIQEGVFKNAYDVNYFQSSLEEEQIKNLSSDDIYEVIAEGKAFWSYEETLQKVADKTTDFWLMDNITIPNKIPFMTLKDGIIYTIKNKKEFFIIREN